MFNSINKEAKKKLFEVANMYADEMCDYFDVFKNVARVIQEAERYGLKIDPDSVEKSLKCYVGQNR